MKVFADLHVHSRYARATSKNITFENMEKYARIKGLTLLGTGDFQHPKWNKEIQEKLKEDNKGILWSKSGFPFLWTTEISFIYSQNGKGRAIHLLMFAPNKKIADKIIEYLSNKGRLDYDGRPIFGISCHDFVRDIKRIDNMIEIIPAHCMTSWFGVFGSERGFNSLQECFGEQSKHIYAIESGMSADPEMLWRFKEEVNVVSFSDAHSFWPWRLGREATIFEIPELSYENIINAIRSGKGLLGTIETPPEYGKYHWDGHRKCDFSCDPKKSNELNELCPKCGKKMTIGVEYRVERIAKETKGYKPNNAKIFYKLIPLHEIIALALDTRIESKQVNQKYNEMIKKFGNELKILMDVSKDEISNSFGNNLAELIILARKGNLKVQPGYDGVYGKVLLPKGLVLKNVKRTKQEKLF